MDKLITITQSEYDRLVRRDERYAALEAAGVDNWSGMEIVEWPEEDCE